MPPRRVSAEPQLLMRKKKLLTSVNRKNTRIRMMRRLVQPIGCWSK
jgi:hypothetical protein